MRVIQKHKYYLLGLIFLLGLILRFYMLGVNPPSLNWDEASTGYNAYSILKTGKDEYGNFLPLSIRSFDDYKPPLYTYLDVSSIAVFGVTEFAVRFPSAMLGSLTILVMYSLVLELFPNEKDSELKLSKYREGLALISALFFAISPWSLQFSRAAYEGNIGLFFLLSALLLFLKSLKKSPFLYLSSICFVLAMYSYHSFRLVVPLLILIMLVLFYKNLLKMKVGVIISVAILIVLSAPIFLSLVDSGQGTASRLSMVTIFGPSPNLDASIKDLEYDQSHNDVIGEIFHNRRVVYFLAITKGYLDHYNPDFLFFHGDGGEQHHAVDMGMLYLFDLPLILFGFVVLCRNLNRRTLLLLGLMLVAPLPSAITTGTPHPVRAIAMLPVFIILSSVGFMFLIREVSSIKYQILGIKTKNILLVGIILIMIVNFTYYLHQYYVETPLEYAQGWQYGYKQAALYAGENENRFQHIIITYKYDQPYVYYLFYNKVDPAWYQRNWNFTGSGQMPRFERKIGKYDFRNINWGEDQKIKNALIIGTPDEIPENPGVKQNIYFPNGDVSLKIDET